MRKILILWEKCIIGTAFIALLQNAGCICLLSYGWRACLVRLQKTQKTARAKIKQTTERQRARDFTYTVYCHRKGVQKCFVNRLFRGEKSGVITPMI